MKPFATLLIAAGVSALLVGCGGGSSDSDATPATPAGDGGTHTHADGSTHDDHDHPEEDAHGHDHDEVALETATDLPDATKKLNALGADFKTLGEKMSKAGAPSAADNS